MIFQTSHWIPLPLERVFLFFADPANLPRIMPPWMDLKLEQVKIEPAVGMAQTSGQPMGVATIAGAGSELSASYRVIPGLPFRIGWVAVITAFARNQHFEDVQAKGPFKSCHHRHEFGFEVRNGIAGTVIGDTVNYEVGFGPLGKLIDALLISTQLKRTFKYRKQAIARLLTP